MDFESEFIWTEAEPSRLNRRAIPNIAVTDHQGRALRLYQDLVKDRAVLIAFTSMTHNAHYPCVEKLAEVRRLLDQTMAARVTLLTLTIDPGKDDLRRWARFATRAGARPGWLFLHADADDVEALRGALFVQRASSPDAGEKRLWRRADLLRMKPEKAVMDCSIGLMRYGDDALDLWGSTPVRASAPAIAERLERICLDSSARCITGRRRGGPFPMQTV